MSANGTEIIRFGDFELDLGRRLLRSTVTAKVVPLTSKAFDTLHHLVERAGQVVQKTELIDAVWSDVVVEENNLTQAISALRRSAM